MSTRRAHDVPETSRAAWRWLCSTRMPEDLRRVFMLALRAGAQGITGHDLVARYDHAHGTSSTATGHPARKRLSDLKALGLVEVSGKVRGSAGRLVEVYRLSGRVPTADGLERWRRSKRPRAQAGQRAELDRLRAEVLELRAEPRALSPHKAAAREAGLKEAYDRLRDRARDREAWLRVELGRARAEVLELKAELRVWAPASRLLQPQRAHRPPP